MLFLASTFSPPPKPCAWGRPRSRAQLSSCSALGMRRVGIREHRTRPKSRHHVSRPGVIRHGHSGRAMDAPCTARPCVLDIGGFSGDPQPLCDPFRPRSPPTLFLRRQIRKPPGGPRSLPTPGRSESPVCPDHLLCNIGRSESCPDHLPCKHGQIRKPRRVNVIPGGAPIRSNASVRRQIR